MTSWRQILSWEVREEGWPDVGSSVQVIANFERLYGPFTEATAGRLPNQVGRIERVEPQASWTWNRNWQGDLWVFFYELRDEFPFPLSHWREFLEPY